MSAQLPPESDGDELVIEDSGFDIVPRSLWKGGKKCGALTARELLVYVALRDAGAERGFRISRKVLLERTGTARGTLDAGLEALAESGWLLITPNFRDTGDRQQSANRYTLLARPITDANDPRLVRHRELVALFERQMEERKSSNWERDEAEAARLGISVEEVRRIRRLGRHKANGRSTGSNFDPVENQDTAGESGATRGQNLDRGAGQILDRGAGQILDREDPDFYTQTSSTQTKTLVTDGSAAGDETEGQTALLVDIPAGVATTVKVDLDALFEIFHALYPKKVAPDLGLKAFKAAVKRGNDPQVIIEAARAIHDHPLCPAPKDARSSDTTVRDRWTYMKLESTWLNQGDWAAPYPVTQKWEDDLAASTARRGGPSGFYSASADDLAKTQDMFNTPTPSAPADDPWAGFTAHASAGSVPF